MRSDFDAKKLGRGVAREALSYAAQTLLFGFGYLRSRHEPKRAADIHTIVFVHGLGANRASFFPLQAYLRLAGHSRQLSFNYGGGGSIEAMAIDLKDRLKREVRGGSIDIIAHSMGGLVARYYVQVLGGDRRVSRLITLATPHHGTHPSVYIPSALMWQFRPNGVFIEHLNAQPPPRVQCVSFAAGEDHLVLPPESGLAPFGETRMFDGLGHISMLFAPQVFSAIRGVLDSTQHGAVHSDMAAVDSSPTLA